MHSSYTYLIIASSFSIVPTGTHDIHTSSNQNINISDMILKKHPKEPCKKLSSNHLRSHLGPVDEF